MKTIKAVIFLLLIVQLAAAHGHSEPVFISGEDTVRVELVFGLRKPDHHIVRKKEWKLFVEDEITPRFPNGFTLTEATGHWQEANGVITEPSIIFTVVCMLNAETENKINDIAAHYKSMFRQEAVLRIDTKIHYWFK
jgi:hypothetical protein